MKRQHNLMMGLTLSIGVGVALLLNSAFLSPVQAVQGQARREEQRQWEYCAIVNQRHERIGGAEISTAHISYYENSGLRIETVPGDEGDRDGTAVVAKAISRLGTDGWEMVGEGPQSKFYQDMGARVLYFKRPKK